MSSRRRPRFKCSERWTCVSTKPGSTRRRRPSITRSGARGGRTSTAGPTSTMSRPSTSTAPSRRMRRSRSTVTTVACSMRITGTQRPLAPAKVRALLRQLRRVREDAAYLGGLERLAPVARVVEEPAPGLGAELSPRDLLLDQARRLEAVITERVGEEAARTVEDVHAAPVDELEDPDLRVTEAHPRPERPVHVLRRRDALLDEADRLVHEQRL